MYKEAEKYGIKAKNSYLEFNSKLKQIELRLKNNEFNVYEEINNCKKEIEKRKTNKDPSLENCAIEDIKII